MPEVATLVAAGAMLSQKTPSCYDSIIMPLLYNHLNDSAIMGQAELNGADTARQSRCQTTTFGSHARSLRVRACVRRRRDPGDHLLRQPRKVYPVETVADAILGTTFFGPDATETFGKFDVALISMFCVAAGMGWPSVRPNDRPAPNDRLATFHGLALGACPLPPARRVADGVGLGRMVRGRGSRASPRLCAIAAGFRGIRVSQASESAYPKQASESRVSGLAAAIRP